MFPIFADFLSTLRGGGGGRHGQEVSVHYRPGWYVKERRVGAQADRYSRQFLTTHPTGRPVRQGYQGGPVQEGSQVGMGGGGWRLHDNQLITSQQTTSEAAKAIFIQGFISIDVLKHARLFQNILGIPRMIKKPGNFGKSRAVLKKAHFFFKRLKLDNLKKSRAFSKKPYFFQKKPYFFD